MWDPVWSGLQPQPWIVRVFPAQRQHRTLAYQVWVNVCGGNGVIMDPYVYPLHQEKVIKHLSYLWERSGIQSEVVCIHMHCVGNGVMMDPYMNTHCRRRWSNNFHLYEIEVGSSQKWFPGSLLLPLLSSAVAILLLLQHSQKNCTHINCSLSLRGNA
jgi:hypothetical protein